jgi:predicted dehydrogenase
MARAEAAREDGIDAVSIVTPNHMHAEPAIAFLQAGINVICDKPLAATPDQARAIAEAGAGGQGQVRPDPQLHGLSADPAGARDDQRGDLGEIRLVQAEYAQDWLTESVEATGNKQAAWRTNVELAGAGALGDIGTHAFNLLSFVTGLRPEALLADLQSFGAGRQVDDNAHVILRFRAGRGGCSGRRRSRRATRTGCACASTAPRPGIEWEQENPNVMTYRAAGEPKRIVTRGGAGLGGGSGQFTRVPPATRRVTSRASPRSTRTRPT